ncbi:hypothetical protein J2X47_001960 [Sphingomonas sp. BE270]|jgi:hypothetical protein|uniref:hypothetical protein n=1 Tax=Sphingomonas sp. BE270 TaxID=2817726 RepID=UPI00285F3871|nr:hypothetical protein [Sphingomonas sp. BE270]MDR7257780.1 hypothetical protein [Sphingomonas sp. BE270]
MSIEAYKIAVKVSLVENVTRGLQMMARHFKSTDADAKALEARLKSIGKMAAFGGIMTGAGLGGLALFKGPLDEAKKYQAELARFASLGFGERVNAQADAYAQGMHTIGTSTRENLTLVSDAMAVFKNLGHAEMAAPIMAKMKFANGVLFGEAGGARDRKFMDLLKVIEFRGGLSSDAEFQRQADFAQKVISGSRGRVDASALLLALKTGGVALSRRSNEGFYLGSEPLIQEFGGSRYGTGAMSIYTNLVQSRGTMVAQQELFRLGLLDPKKVQFNKQGALKKALPGAFYGASILENEGELALLQKVLLPAFAAKGITSPEMITREIGMVLGNRTGSALMTRIYQQQQTLMNQIAANKNAYGIDALFSAANRTPTGKEQALMAKEADLKLKIGQVILPYYVKGLTMALDVMTRLNAFIRANPTFTKIAVGGFALVSVAAVVGGSLTLLTAGLRGLLLIRNLVPAFRAVGVGLSILRGGLGYLPMLFRYVVAALGPVGLAIAAIATVGWLVYNNWKEIKSALFANFKDIGDAVRKLFNGDIMGAIGLFGRAFLLSFQTVINTIIAGVNAVNPLFQIPKASFAGNADGSSPGVRPAGGKPLQVTSNVHLDGHRIATVVTKHQAKAAGRPNAGSTGFDGSRAMPSIAMSAMK